ncbi:hypothetical protein PHYSODRAFT_321324 [Phytophthora sojae]|uniref:Uncharacterized protein n=1 Tax=Phytophthora sojae (strain P6497) TaxID=1094619 RepID=G4YK23_PHYSP|nr:hypothetical protein PHYSODRAFT_321324 [Phytophthora sojae]EGZ27528.1 hypothetical protein PHYSODRAFT_321324 [Phytophthora sojae]|eukprot:XP_009514803.1 hypothetical protein PHYSODRAFT_321324 [Phytophthora sojae]
MEWRYRNGARGNGRRKQASVKPSTDETSDDEANGSATEASDAVIAMEVARTSALDFVVEYGVDDEMGMQAVDTGYPQQTGCTVVKIGLSCENIPATELAETRRSPAAAATNQASSEAATAVEDREEDLGTATEY